MAKLTEQYRQLTTWPTAVEKVEIAKTAHGQKILKRTASAVECHNSFRGDSFGQRISRTQLRLGMEVVSIATSQEG
jgi:hypothetical protein